MDERALRTEVRNRIQSGLVPRWQNGRTFAGSGDGHPCECCDRRIGEQNIQYEVDFPSHDGGCRTVKVHMECYHIWRDESVGRAIEVP
jgi:hypothetical protein